MLNGNSPPFVTDYLSIWPGDEMRTGGGLSLKGGGVAEFPPWSSGITAGMGMVSENQDKTQRCNDAAMEKRTRRAHNGRRTSN